MDLPDFIYETLERPKFAAATPLPAESAAGNLSCGCVVFIEVSFTNVSEELTCRYRTNGCPYMVAAAESAAGYLTGRAPVSLKGEPDSLIRQAISSHLGPIPAERSGCVQSVVEAVMLAFSGMRRRRIGEGSAGSILVCSCFGVAEDSIVEYLRRNPAADLADVGRDLRAGFGCGSCRMTILAIIDEIRADK